MARPDDTYLDQSHRRLTIDTVVPTILAKFQLPRHGSPGSRRSPPGDEPDHQHFDFRFLFRTDADVSALQAEEVLDYSWQFTDAITAEPLRSRLLAVPTL
jgi:hypothetical protein